MAQETGRRHIDPVMATGVVLAVIGGLSVVIVCITGVAGLTPSRTLTWVGMITLPIAFILMAVQFVRMIRARRD